MGGLKLCEDASTWTDAEAEEDEGESVDEVLSFPCTNSATGVFF